MEPQNHRMSLVDGVLKSTLELRKLEPRKARQFVQSNPMGHQQDSGQKRMAGATPTGVGN